MAVQISMVSLHVSFRDKINADIYTCACTISKYATDFIREYYLRTNIRTEVFDIKHFFAYFIFSFLHSFLFFYASLPLVLGSSLINDPTHHNFCI